MSAVTVGRWPAGSDLAGRWPDGSVSSGRWPAGSIMHVPSGMVPQGALAVTANIIIGAKYQLALAGGLPTTALIEPEITVGAGVSPHMWAAAGSVVDATFTAEAIEAHVVEAPLSAGVIMSAEAVEAHVVEVVVSAEAMLSAVAVEAHVVEAPLSAGVVLGAQVVAERAIDAPITVEVDSDALIMTEGGGAEVVAPITVEGTVSAAVAQGLPVAAPIAVEGSVGAQVMQAKPVAAPVTATASMSAVVVPVKAVTANITVAGTVTASALSVKAVAAPIVVTGSMSASTRAAKTVTAPITVTASMSAAVEAVTEVTVIGRTALEQHGGGTASATRTIAAGNMAVAIMYDGTERTTMTGWTRRVGFWHAGGQRSLTLWTRTGTGASVSTATGYTAQIIEVKASSVGAVTKSVETYESQAYATITPTVTGSLIIGASVQRSNGAVPTLTDRSGWTTLDTGIDDRGSSGTFAGTGRSAVTTDLATRTIGWNQDGWWCFAAIELRP